MTTTRPWLDQQARGKNFDWEDAGTVNFGTSGTSNLVSVAGRGEFAAHVKVGDATATEAGVIRWTGSDFEGYTGSEWKSFTIAGGGTITGTGSPGQIAFWDSASSITGEAPLFWNATANNLILSDAADFLMRDDSGSPVDVFTIDGATGHTRVGGDLDVLSGNLFSLYDSANTDFGYLWQDGDTTKMIPTSGGDIEIGAVGLPLYVGIAGSPANLHMEGGAIRLYDLTLVEFGYLLQDDTTTKMAPTSGGDIEIGAAGLPFYVGESGAPVNMHVEGGAIRLYDLTLAEYGSLWQDDTTTKMAPTTGGDIEIGATGQPVYVGEPGSPSYLLMEGGDIRWTTDGAGNIGTSGNYRPGTVYAETSVVVGDTLTLTSNSITGSVELYLDDNRLVTPIPLTETGTTALVGFTATSIIGALNEALVSGGGGGYWDKNGSILTPHTVGDHIWLYDSGDIVIWNSDPTPFPTFSVDGATGNTVVRGNLSVDEKISASPYLTGSAQQEALEVSYQVNLSSGDDYGVLISKFDISSPGTSYLIFAERNGSRKFSVEDTGLTTVGADLLWDGTGNIGSSGGADRPVNVYASNSVVVGDTLTLTSNSITGSVELYLDDNRLVTPIPLTEVGTTGLVGFTATSIVGALNEARTAGAGGTLQQVTDLGNTTTNDIEILAGSDLVLKDSSATPVTMLTLDGETGDVVTSGSITWSTDGIGDIGTAGDLRPDSIYAKTLLKAGDSFSVFANGIVGDALRNAATGNEVVIDVQYEVNKATSGDDLGLRLTKVDTASPGDSLFTSFGTYGGATPAFQGLHFISDAGSTNIGSVGTYKDLWWSDVSAHPAYTFAKYDSEVADSAWMGYMGVVASDIAWSDYNLIDLFVTKLSSRRIANFHLETFESTGSSEANDFLVRVESRGAGSTNADRSTLEVFCREGDGSISVTGADPVLHGSTRSLFSALSHKGGLGIVGRYSIGNLGVVSQTADINSYSTNPAVAYRMGYTVDTPPGDDYGLRLIKTEAGGGSTGDSFFASFEKTGGDDHAFIADSGAVNVGSIADYQDLWTAGDIDPSVTVVKQDAGVASGAWIGYHGVLSSDDAWTDYCWTEHYMKYDGTNRQAGTISEVYTNAGAYAYVKGVATAANNGSNSLAVLELYSDSGQARIDIRGDSSSYNFLRMRDGAGTVRYNITSEGLADQEGTLNAATGDEVGYDLQYEVNKSISGNDYGIRVVKDDTASPGSSYLIWLGMDTGVPPFSRMASVSDTGDLYTFGDVQVNGTVYAGDGSSEPSIQYDDSLGNYTATDVCGALDEIGGAVIGGTNLEFLDEPVEVPDGFIVVFTFGAYKAGKIAVFKNGQMLHNPDDYSETNPGAGTITMVSAPAAVDKIWAIYVKG